MIYTNDEKYGGKFKKLFSNTLKKSSSVDIATGYFGADLIDSYKNDLVKIARNGRVRILIGMIFHSGLRDKQNQSLCELDSALKNVNTESGIFISLTQYHGKMYSFNYLIDRENKSTFFVGSSNFSKSGFSDQLECNAEILDPSQKELFKNYLEYLFSSKTTKRLAEVDLKREKVTSPPTRDLEDYIVKEIPFETAIGEFEIKLRVDKQPCSSLNLYFAKGRKNKNGLYAPRPWYEVEITSSTSELRNHFYPKSVPKNKTRIGYFTAFIKDENKIYRIRMSVGSASGKAIASESGGRATLGKIIKGKLERSGCLKRGEVITSEILANYGNDTITLRKFNDENYELIF